MHADIQQISFLHFQKFERKKLQKSTGTYRQAQCLEERQEISYTGYCNFGYMSRTYISVNMKNHLCHMCTGFVMSGH